MTFDFVSVLHNELHNVKHIHAYSIVALFKKKSCKTNILGIMAEHYFVCSDVLRHSQQFSNMSVL